MRTIHTALFALLALAVGLGCGLNPFSGSSSTETTNTGKDKTIADKAIDTAVGDTKIGIQECDDVVELLNEQINDPDENFVSKAVKRTILNKFRDELKRSLEENQANKQEVGEFCAEFKKNLQESLSNSNTAK
jgi:hypothetical protein